MYDFFQLTLSQSISLGIFSIFFFVFIWLVAKINKFFFNCQLINKKLMIKIFIRLSQISTLCSNWVSSTTGGLSSSDEKLMLSSNTYV